MAKIRLYGETSGYVELAAPAVADDSTLDISLVPTIDTAPSDGQVLTWNASESKWEAKDLVMTQKKIAAFTSSGTWTVPAGVTYAIAHILGGGGGAGTASSGAGGTSSVSFASGTVSSLGGRGRDVFGNHVNGPSADAGAANSGRGADYQATNNNGNSATAGSSSGDSQWIVAGADVTPAASITITVGGGGTAGSNGAAGGSGYVYIEYYEAV